MGAGLIHQLSLIGWLQPKQLNPGAVLGFIGGEKIKAGPGAVLNKAVFGLLGAASSIKPVPNWAVAEMGKEH